MPAAKPKSIAPSVLALAVGILAFSHLFPSAAHAQLPEPAFPTVEAADQFKLQRLYPRQKFDCPVALAIMPLDKPRLVLALQRGELWLLPEDEILGSATRFLDLRPNLKDVTQFEEGVHGLAFHPDFAKNGKFYLSYSDINPRRTVLAEFRTQKGKIFRGDPTSRRPLLQEPHIMANHFGGNIAFGPDKKLYLTIGDGGLRDDPYRISQNPFSLLGKVLRIDPDTRSGALPYGIPADNPFADKQEYRPEIWALGLRNPWGFSFDSKTGDLWLADVGQDIWEEVNIIKKGANYGWSDRDGPRPAPFHTTPYAPNLTFEEPIHAYTHAEGISVTGGFMYHGDRLPHLQGCFIHGDWGTGTLWALRYDPDSQKILERLVIYRRPETPENPFNPTMISPDTNGEIVLMSQDGAIYTLVDSIE
ncbi:PQQ-dependent sugar dehydrogenase [Phragmitibacter flavus]|uniref:PQQ-dependent sugar dehydrogenase n=1 Tax=Phragmitibacter flavus TaxID=2576071 RepID=A0A5R8KAV2_9BACT|nr:PQQ-dependent sugar dehydrogenase [Phragmitibacter flavus]TLD68669.1 PQQ-dependent sugar dehydrogenase [Phragmitibacter flavus]